MKNIKAAVAGVVLASVMLFGGCSTEPPTTAQCIEQSLTMERGFDCIEKDLDQRMSSAPAIPTDVGNMDKPVVRQRPEGTTDPVVTRTPASKPSSSVDWSSGAPKDWQDQIGLFYAQGNCDDIENAIVSLPQEDSDIQNMIVEQSKIFGCRN